MSLKNICKIFGIILVFSHFLLCVTSKTINENNESELLRNIPPIYQMDDFDNCKSRNHSYCFAKIRLSAQPNYLILWTSYIQNLTEAKCLLSPEIIERGICMDKTINNVDKIRQFTITNELIKNEINPVYLKGDTYYLRCQDNYVTQNSNFDYFVISLGVFYATVIIIATLVDFCSPVHVKNSSVFQILHCWSLKNNWKKFIEYKSPDGDYQNLKFIAGIRTICCLTIIIIHALIYSALLFIDEDLVNFYLNQKLSRFLTKIFGQAIIFCIQIFFFVSHFLNAVQMLRHATNPSNNVDINFVIKRIGKRIFRYLPHLVLMTLFANSDIFKKSSSTPIHDWLYFNQHYCQKNWWLMFLFISNEVRINDMCNPVGWYLSADIQLYIVSTVAMYFIIKYNLGNKFLMGMFILATAIHGLNLYRVPIFLGAFLPPNSKVDKIFSDNIYYIHNSTISSLATVFAGQIYGLKYYHTTTKTKTNISFTLWSLYIFGPILLQIVLLEISLNGKLQNTISTLLFKPLCCLFLGNLFLGFRNNYGKKFRWFLQTRIMDFVGKLSFCIYFYQGYIAFLVHFKQPYSVVSLRDELIKISLIVPLIFIMGYLLVDQPVQNIIKLIGTNKKKTSCD